MADGKGIRRLVQIVLDKASGNKIKREVGDALDKGTDPRRAKKNLRAIEGGLATLRRAAVRLGGVLVAALGARALFRFGKKAVETAAEAEAIWNRLGQAVTNAGGNFKELLPEIQKVARAVQDVTTVGDEDFAQILTELITITDDYDRSLENIVGVLDLAAAKQIDLTTAAQLYGRAMVGQTSTLTRYGIVIEEGADAIEVLRTRFAGFAANEAAGHLGLMKQLRNEWGDFLQVMGEVFTGAEGGSSLIGDLGRAVKDLTLFVEQNKIVWQGYFDSIFAGFERLAGVIKTVLDRQDPLGKEIRDRTAEILRLKENETALDAERLRIGQDILRLAKEQDEQRLRASIFSGAPQRAAEDRVALLEREIVALQRLALLVDELTDARRRGAAPPPPPPPSTGGGMLAGGARPFSSRTDQFGTGGTMFDQFLGGFETARSTFGHEARLEVEKTGDAIAELPEIAADAAAGMELALVTAAYGITDAFAEGFEIMARDMKDLPDAAKAIGLGIVRGLAGGMAQYHTAQGVGKLAEGTWPPNPIALASAAKHFLAAAAFKALGALTRGTGTGSSSASPGGTNTGRSAATGVDSSRGPEVHIYIDPIDPENPLHRKVIGRAAQLAEEQYGTSIPIHVQSRAGSAGI